jgi:CheY-like chemotaxis protein
MPHTRHGKSRNNRRAALPWEGGPMHEESLEDIDESFAPDPTAPSNELEAYLKDPITTLANVNIVTIGSGATLQQAVDLMNEKRIGALLVVDNGEIAGIFTERDILVKVVGRQYKLEEHKPDLILMDIQLPGVSGLEVTKWIKEDDNIRHIPVIAITAFAMKGDEDRINGSGCEAYIAKPISVSDFLTTIRRFLD